MNDSCVMSCMDERQSGAAGNSLLHPPVPAGRVGVTPSSVSCSFHVDKTRGTGARTRGCAGFIG